MDNVAEIRDGDERRQHVMLKLLTQKIRVDPKHVYKPRDDDVIIVGPMKSGTTWLQQILHQLRTKGDESFKDIYGVTWYINNKGDNIDFNLNADQVCNPRIYKHHENYGIIPMTDKQKQIVITRNPYDSAYSYTKFVNQWFGGNEDIDDEEMADMFKVIHSSEKMGNFSCTGSWWAHANDSNVLFLFYEDMHKDLKFMIKKIADFVGISLTDDEFQRVYGFCTFDYMVKHKEQFRAEPIIDAWINNLKLKKWTPKEGMVREGGGKIGQGVKNIGPKLKETVNTLWHETITKRYGFKNYDEMYSKHTLFKTPRSQL